MSRRLLVLGAGGDLAHRLLFPALAELRAAGRFPDDLEVVGSTRDDQTDEAFRDEVAGALEEHAAEVDADARSQLTSQLTHRTADATDPEALGDLLRDGPPTIVYLALPPALFEPALETLAACDLPDGSAVVIEKPFGEDLASARRLNELLTAFDEDDIYRMDHFLGLPATSNLMALRFANRLFEPAWRTEHVERIEVTWDETLALEGRAGYYDSAGALRDMIQNHLLAVLSVVLMDRPEPMTRETLRSARVRALRSLQPPAAEAMADSTLRARYTEGDGHPAYVDEEGVEPERQTETLAEVTLSSDEHRWRGVPLMLRAGKALGQDRHELVIGFRPPVGMEADGGPDSGRLRLDLDTNELRLDIAVSASEPAEGTRIPVRADLPSGELGAYATMLAALFAGDHAPFVRDDEAEEAWRIVQPVLDAWDEGDVPLQEYSAGSDGPD